jgi:hypothetical protein
MCKNIALMIMLFLGLQSVASDKKYATEIYNKTPQAKEFDSYYAARFANMSDEKTPLSLAEQFAQEEQDRTPLGQVAEPKTKRSHPVALVSKSIIRDDKLLK